MPSSFYRLPQFTSLLVTGADASTFLQGQISFDMDRLTSARMELASCNSAQGRVQALLWLVKRSEGVVMILPTELRDAVLARLRKYVLRARVTFATDTLIVAGTSDAAGPDAERGHVEVDSTSRIRWPGEQARTLLLLPAAQEVPEDVAFEQAWRLNDIRAGLPQIHTTTYEAFVAQMLNVDLLGGIGFEKGCYTGQEIIARAHFRGTVKRRMFRFAANCAAPAPGTRIVSSDIHAGDVVDAAATDDGCELLAVISLAQLEARLSVDGVEDSQLRRLTLPYRVTSDE